MNARHDAAVQRDHFGNLVWARVAEQTSHTSMTELAFRVPPRCAAWVNVYSCAVWAEHVKSVVANCMQQQPLALSEGTTLVNERIREFERVAPGVRAQPPWLLPDTESNRFGTESRASRRGSPHTLGKPTFNAKDRERWPSASCVHWLTCSFRAKNLSSPDGTRTDYRWVNNPAALGPREKVAERRLSD